jgi:hypothetical protein
VRDGLRLVDSFTGFDAVVFDGAGEMHYSSGLQSGAM